MTELKNAYKLAEKSLSERLGFNRLNNYSNIFENNWAFLQEKFHAEGSFSSITISNTICAMNEPIPIHQYFNTSISPNHLYCFPSVVLFPTK